MTENEIKQRIIDQIDKIAYVIKRGNDIEIRHDSCGIKVLEVDKKIVR